MEEEIIDHIQDLKKQGINVKIDEDQINDLIKRILDKEKIDKKKIDKERDVFKIFYKHLNTKQILFIIKKISTEDMNEAINNYSYNNNLNDFINEYNSFS